MQGFKYTVQKKGIYSTDNDQPLTPNDFSVSHSNNQKYSQTPNQRHTVNNLNKMFDI